MSELQVGQFSVLSRAFARIPLDSRRLRVAALGLGLSVALLGLWYRLFRARDDDGDDEHDAVAAELRRTAPSRASARNRYSSLRRSVRQSESQGDGRTSALGGSPESLVCAGIDGLAEVIKSWERALNSEIKGKVMTEQELYEGLQDAMNRCQEIQTDISKLVEKYNLEFNAGGDNMSLGSTSLLPGTSTSYAAYNGYGDATFTHRNKTMSILSGDSFVSALEELIPAFDDVDILNREHLDLDPTTLKLYQDALKVVDSVQCRVFRTDFLNCQSDEEFLAKLHCVRRALNMLTADTTKRSWLVDSGRKLIGGLLVQANKDPDSFYAAYDEMLVFLARPGAIPQLEEELKTRRVQKASFYDVVLDFILMDAFDDLASPPSAVFAVTQNRFLSASFKENTLRTVVWSVLKSKRARLTAESGFVAHFYDISEAVSPTLAWGFLGSDEALRELCYYFKDQIVTLMTDIFSFHRVRYTTLTDLAEDVWMILRTRVEMILQRISPDPIEPAS